MTVFIDVHVLLWAMFSPNCLSPRASTFIRSQDSTLLFSHASLAELLNKAGRGKVRIEGSNVQIVFEDIAALDVQFVPILQADIITAASLPHHHSDPFDRLLIAQAMRLSVPVLTVDAKFQQYGVETIW